MRERLPKRIQRRILQRIELEGFSVERVAMLEGTTVDRVLQLEREARERLNKRD